MGPTQGLFGHGGQTEIQIHVRLFYLRKKIRIKCSFVLAKYIVILISFRNNNFVVCFFSTLKRVE